MKIHKKLNEEKLCNSKNDKLLLHSDKCKKISNSYTHGGYKCGKNNTWDESNCVPYYCDIGYYFDQKQKKCIENCKFDNEKSFFIYEDNFNKTFDIKKNTKYNFIFPFSLQKQYLIIADYDNQPKPAIIYIEKIFEQNFDYKLHIEEINTTLKLLNLNEQNSRYSSIKSEESLIFLENSKDYILYLDSIYKNSKTEFKLAEYKNEMSYDEMLNHDSKYFSDYKETIHTFSKDKMYLLYIKSVELDPYNIFMQNLYKEETIEIVNLETNFLYLEKNKIYTLDFRKNSINRMIKLSRETLNSVVNIINKNIILNSKNLYYEMDENYIEKLTLKIENDNALIEFLFKQDDSEIAVLRFNKKIFKLNKKYNIMAIPIKYSSNLIEIELSRNEFLTNFTIYFGYSIPPYNYFSTDIEENIFTMEDKFNFIVNEHYKGNVELMEDEFYCVMIENFGEDVLMSIEIKEGDDDGDEDSDVNQNALTINLERWIMIMIMILLYFPF